MKNKGTKAVLLMDTREAARLLAESPRKVWSLTFEEKPELTYIHLGRCVTYPFEDLQRWIDGQKKGENVTTPSGRILSVLTQWECNPKQNGKGWSGTMPRPYPSLSVSEGDDGRALVCCHAS